MRKKLNTLNARVTYFNTCWVSVFSYQAENRAKDKYILGLFLFTACSKSIWILSLLRLLFLFQVLKAVTSHAFVKNTNNAYFVHQIRVLAVSELNSVIFSNRIEAVLIIPKLHWSFVLWWVSESGEVGVFPPLHAGEGLLLCIRESNGDQRLWEQPMLTGGARKKNSPWYLPSEPPCENWHLLSHCTFSGSRLCMCLFVWQ